MFYEINPSGRTMALESTQPPTEMSTRRPLRTLPLSCAHFLEILGVSTSCIGIAFFILWPRTEAPCVVGLKPLKLPTPVIFSYSQGRI